MGSIGVIYRVNDSAIVHVRELNVIQNNIRSQDFNQIKYINRIITNALKFQITMKCIFNANVFFYLHVLILKSRYAGQMVKKATIGLDLMGNLTSKFGNIIF